MLMRSTQLNWCLIALFTLATIGMFALTGFRFDWHGFVAFPLALVGLAIILGRKARNPNDHRYQTFVNVVITSLQMFAITLAGAAMSYSAARTALPFADAALYTIDQRLGLDWMAYANWIDQSRALAVVLELSYATLIAQAYFAPLLLGCFGDRAQLDRLVAAFAISFFITNILFIFAPAVAVYQFLHLPYHHFHNFVPVTYVQHVAPLEALRHGRLNIFSFNDVVGLISFPSFHSCGAALLIWAFWSHRLMRYPFLILNTLMLMSVPVFGAHYFIDEFAGIAVAAVSVLLATRLHASGIYLPLYISRLKLSSDFRLSLK